MTAAIVEDFGEPLTDGERPRVRGEHEDLVDQVHEFLLPEQDADEKVCRSGTAYVPRLGVTSRGDEKDDKDD